MSTGRSGGGGSGVRREGDGNGNGRWAAGGGEGWARVSVGVPVGVVRWMEWWEGAVEPAVPLALRNSNPGSPKPN